MGYLLKRTARAALTLWLALTFVFFMIRLMPGNPVDRMIAEIMRNCPGCSTERIEALVRARMRAMNLDYGAPLHEQYVGWLVSIFQGDLGMSFKHGQPVSDLVGQSLPWTLLVMTSATFLIFAIAVVWGAVVAYREASIFDTVSSGVSIMSSAIPFYVLGFLLILVLGYKLAWFPIGGKTSRFADAGFTPAFILDVIHHAALPIASVVVTQAGLQTLAMRGNSIQVLGEDYVRVARLRGLSDTRIATRYVARNAILPMYTGFLMLIGYNLGGSIILEQVFTYRGMGWYMFDALQSADYALMMGTFLVYAVALVLAVFIADLTYSRVDPRVASSDSREAF